MKKMLKLFTPTLPARGMSVQMAAKAAQLNPLKRGREQCNGHVCIPSPLRGRARVGVQYLHPLNTFKLFVTCLTALLVSVFTMPLQAVPGDDFGRLFSRQNERKNLDILRQNQKLKVVTPQDALQPESTEDVEPPELPDPITMQGYVKRSDGSSTVWINNKAVQEDSSVDNAQIGRLNPQKNNAGASSDSLNVKIPANGKHIRLKAGQVYMPETNQIRELKTVEKEKLLNLEETGVIGDDAHPSNVQTENKIE